MRPSITHHLCLLVTVFIAALALNGCVVYPFSGGSRDVTSDPIWWGDMHRNEILEVNEDSLLDGVCLTTSAYNDSTMNNPWSRNVTPEMFKANPGKYWSGLHLIPKGTRLRCVKLERYWTSENSTYIVWAEILDGEYKGTIVSTFCATGDIHKKGSLQMTTDMVHRVD